jgi:hypothetical protein
MGLNRIAQVWEQENKGSKQDRQNLGAIKPKGLNRIAFMPFGFLAPRL